MATPKKIRYVGYIYFYSDGTPYGRDYETLAFAIKDTKARMNEVRKAFEPAEWFIHTSDTGKCVAAGGIYNDGTRYRIRSKGSLMIYDRHDVTDKG